MDFHKEDDVKNFKNKENQSLNDNSYEITEKSESFGFKKWLYNKKIQDKAKKEKLREKDEHEKKAKKMMINDGLSYKEWLENKMNNKKINKKNKVKNSTQILKEKEELALKKENHKLLEKKERLERLSKIRKKTPDHKKNKKHGNPTLLSYSTTKNIKINYY